MEVATAALASDRVNYAKLASVVRRIDHSDPAKPRPPPQLVKQVLVKPTARPTRMEGPESPPEMVLTACKKGQHLSLRRLLDAGVPLTTDRKGDSALHLAAWFGHRPCVDTLLAHGAAVDVLNNAGETPLHCAARWGYPAICAALLGAKANPQVRTRDDKRALELCRDERALRVLYPSTMGEEYDQAASSVQALPASDAPERPKTSRGPGVRSEPQSAPAQADDVTPVLVDQGEQLVLG